MGYEIEICPPGAHNMGIIATLNEIKLFPKTVLL